METSWQQNPYGPLIVPLTLLFGFLYVSWLGYSSEDPEPVHKALAFFFELKFTTVGAAVMVSIWAVYAVRLNLWRQRFGPPSPFSSLSRALPRRLGLPPGPPSLSAVPQLSTALAGARFLDDEMPHVTGELGAWLGDALCRERSCHWERHDDPELGTFSYQASQVLLPQKGQPPLKLNVFSVALRAVQDPQELSRFATELDRAISPA